MFGTAGSLIAFYWLLAFGVVVVVFSIAATLGWINRKSNNEHSQSDLSDRLGLFSNDDEVA